MIRQSVFALGLVVAPALAGAQDMTLGAAEFANSCAQCHGAAGRGDGPIAGFLNTALPDLTALQAENGGVFPVARVYAVIDGTAEVGGHGSRDMPAWGQRYSVNSNAMLGYEHSAETREIFVRGRILALVEYLSSIQED